MADDLRAALREVVAYTIWSHTGGEGECPRDGVYEACEQCMRTIFHPAADAVLALLDDWVPRAEHEQGQHPFDPAFNLNREGRFCADCGCHAHFHEANVVVPLLGYKGGTYGMVLGPCSGDPEKNCGECDQFVPVERKVPRE